MPKAAPPKSAVDQLAAFFERNGYVRRQSEERLDEGYESYKKGDEVRLVAETKEELRLMRRLLRECGFRPGKPFEKGRQWRLPLYGRDAVAKFLELVGADDSQP